MNLITVPLILILFSGIFVQMNVHTITKDHAEVKVGSKTFKFDWTYILTFGDKPDDLKIDKNLHASQATVYAKPGSIISAIVRTCCGDYGNLNVSIGDKVNVSNDGHVNISNEKHATQVGGCDDEDCEQSWQLPTVTNGTYNLVYYVIGETEVNELYVTKIKIS